jgi:hypothetical protein
LSDGAKAIGDINVLGEALNVPIGFGKGCPSLEGEGLCEGSIKEGMKRPNHPDIFLKKDEAPVHLSLHLAKKLGLVL